MIFAANHASHVDTPLLLTCLPLRFRHRTVVAAAADYFFDRTLEGRRLVASRSPPSRSSGPKVNRRSADTAAGAARRRLEPGHLPRGRPRPRRLGPALHGRCRLPRPAHRSPRRARLRARDPARPARTADVETAPGGRPAGGSGAESARTHGLRRSPVTVIFGEPLHPADGEDARRFGARVEAAVAVLADEVAYRLVERPSPRRRRVDPLPTGPGHRALAPGLVARSGTGSGPHRRQHRWRRPQPPRQRRPALAAGLSHPTPGRGTRTPGRRLAYRTWAAWNRTSGARTRTST